MNTFQQRIHHFAGRIPKGKVATYGQLAHLAGNPKAARAVGMIMSKNTDTKKIPCHRVVASSGKLIGYAFGGVKNKRHILESEGVVFRNNNVDLRVSQWHG